MNKYFTAKELACKCGCGMLPAEDFMAKVSALREKAGFPFPVTSAARCPAHNAAVSKTGVIGPHTSGRAIDIAVRGELALRVVHLALEAGFTGIGVSQKGASRFIHLDDLEAAEGRPRPTIWSY